MVFTNEKCHPKTIAIPANESYDDFYSILYNTIEILANWEVRSADDIIKDIATTFVDRLEFRIISEITEDGKIPLEYAADCVEGLK